MLRLRAQIKPGQTSGRVFCEVMQKEEDTGKKRSRRRSNTDIFSLYSSLSGAIRAEGVGGGRS